MITTRDCINIYLSPEKFQKDKEKLVKRLLELPNEFASENNHRNLKYGNTNYLKSFYLMALISLYKFKPQDDMPSIYQIWKFFISFTLKDMRHLFSVPEFWERFLNFYMKDYAKKMIKKKKREKAIMRINNIFVEILETFDKDKELFSRREKKKKYVKRNLIKIRSLIKENNFNESLKKLKECKRIAEREMAFSLIKEIDSLQLNAKSLLRKEKQKEYIKKDLVEIQSLLNENKFNESIKKLEECKRISEKENFITLIKKVDALSLKADSLLKEFKINKIKKTVLNLGIKFTRLQIIEIVEKCGLKEEQLIIDTVLEMIKNKEIYAEYFSSSKSIAFDQQANIDEIDRLMEAYKEWEGKKVGKK